MTELQPLTAAPVSTCIVLDTATHHVGLTHCSKSWRSARQNTHNACQVTEPLRACMPPTALTASYTAAWGLTYQDRLSRGQRRGCYHTAKLLSQLLHPVAKRCPSLEGSLQQHDLVHCKELHEDACFASCLPVRMHRVHHSPSAQIPPRQHLSSQIAVVVRADSSGHWCARGGGSIVVLMQGVPNPLD